MVDKCRYNNNGEFVTNSNLNSNLQNNGIVYNNDVYPNNTNNGRNSPHHRFHHLGRRISSVYGRLFNQNNNGNDNGGVYMPLNNGNGMNNNGINQNDYVDHELTGMELRDISQVNNNNNNYARNNNASAPLSNNGNNNNGSTIVYVPLPVAARPVNHVHLI